jgi:hypothetical protein
MAETIRIPGSSGSAKIRNPWGAFVLALVTLGIYYLVWYYKTNRELRDYGVGDSPLTSLLAISLGAFVIVPPFVSWWRCFGRIREAQQKAGVEDLADQWIGFILYIVAVFFLPFEIVYAQQQLNKLWERVRAAAG